MTLTYEEVGARIFGDREFDSAEFGRRIGTSRGAKLLSEFKHRGIVARSGHGRYRFLAPSERPDLRSFEWSRVRNIVLHGPSPKAWTGSTAVEAWTGGRYTVSPTVYSRIFNLAIPSGTTEGWKDYLRRHKVAFDTRKRVGARVELVPVRKLTVETVGGEPVIPRARVVKLIREHPSIYADAEELLLGKTS